MIAWLLVLVILQAVVLVGAIARWKNARSVCQVLCDGLAETSDNLSNAGFALRRASAELAALEAQVANTHAESERLRDMLGTYARGLEQEEGTDFLECEMGFTKEEVAEIRALAAAPDVPLTKEQWLKIVDKDTGEPCSVELSPRVCPHAEPFVYCPECKVSPCPLGLGAAAPEGGTDAR